MNPVSSILKALKRFAPEAVPAPLADRYESALHLLAAGDADPMHALAASSLGDAWFALATSYALSINSPEDAAASTVAFGKAAECKQWLNDLSNVAHAECTRRLFLGLGSTADYRALAREWESHHFPGYQNELKLAWIYAFGPEDVRDREAAWKWLAYGEARWGQREEDLPSSSVPELRSIVEKAVPKRHREKLIEEANRVAYQEFVEGK